MEKYFKQAYHRLNTMPAGIQGILWFISFKLSFSILQGVEDVPTHLFTIVLHFVLAMIILSAILAFIDVMSNIRNRYR